MMLRTKLKRWLAKLKIIAGGARADTDFCSTDQGQGRLARSSNGTSIRSSMSSASETLITADERGQALDSPQGEREHFPFLHLTRELRDRVYIELLKSRVAVSPPSYSEVSQGNRRRTGDGPLGLVMCAPFPAHVSFAPSLLLLNRQVQGEVKEVLSERRLDIRPLTYTLDCMAVGGGVLFPTWLSVPVLSSHVDIVETNLRLETNVRVGGVQTYSNPIGWVSGNGGPAHMIWSLLGLLNRFLSRGADFLSEPPRATSTTVGLLVLNVVTPSEGVLPVEAVGPETFFEEILFWIDNFIGMLLRDEHGKMTREKVGMIRLCLDGQERSLLDVANGSRGMHFQPSRCSD